LVASEGVDPAVEEAFPTEADPSSAAVLATPLHSDTFAPTTELLARRTVTCVTGRAVKAYQSSTRVKEPERNPTGPFVHVFPAESVTEVTELDDPVCKAIDATSASPAVELIGTLKLVAALVTVAT
jgi:hypothetical protein